MITRDRALVERGLLAALPGMVKEFLRGVPRLERLHRYAQGRHDILLRERAEGLPNARLTHGFPRYIAQVSAGYLLDEPVRYQDAPGQSGARQLSAVYEAAGAQAADSELAMQLSVYGRAVSLNYVARSGGMRVAALDPRSAFVVWDDTVEQGPLLGVLLRPLRDAEGRHTGGELLVYTQAERLSYRCDGHWQPKGAPGRQPHPFGRMPMVGYMNDAEGQGDFEELLPLIDAYDLLNSDRVNDRAQFADALLVLTGVCGLSVEGEEADHRRAQQHMRQNRTLTLPDHDAKAQWLVKNPLEQDIDVLRRALAQDIHKFSMTPDFSDERFAGDLSGIAIRYMLFCLEQRIKLKERRFITGLRERARVTAGYMRAQGLAAPDAERVRIVLKRSLPQSELERARTLQALQGLTDSPATAPDGAQPTTDK